MNTYNFIKDKDGWYIDLKNSPFNRKQKGMVRGADTLLDIFAQGKDEVRVKTSTSSIEGYEQLERKSILNFGFAGANYLAKEYRGEEINHKLWLCPVTLWVFWRYPKNIYYKVVSE